MTTHEVEQLLGLTKQTLIYYEKEGLITPLRNENNYRDYSQDDIDILRFIQLLRSMEMTIDEVKSILNKQSSIREVLESKKEFIENSRIKLDHIEEAIQSYIKRKEVKVSFHDKPIENWTKKDTLFLNDGFITYHDKTIDFSDIITVHISMCSVIAMQRAVFAFFNYYVDIDIQTIQDTYSFQIMNDDQVLSMFQYFQKHHFSLQDPLDLMNLYTQKQDRYLRYKYLDIHFKEWAKTYQLDNPRGNYFQWRLQYMDEFKDVKDDASSSKEKKGLIKKWLDLF